MSNDNRAEFNFLQCLGKGGYGEVYLATMRRRGLSQQVAVKVLKEDLEDPEEAVSRLRDEGRMLAILDHPCILSARDMCRLGGRIALVTEYVEGIDLSKCCKPDRLLPQRVVVSAIGEVADALDVAFNKPSPETGNRLELIHRDIKPENIRLTIHGQTKLLDFGIARSAEMSRHARTRAGELPFTPGYAAPETFRRGEQGPEADVYALGSTMYRLLVGERLYEGLHVGQQFDVAAIRNNYDPWIKDRLAKLDVEDMRLFDLMRRMLAYDKTERPTARQVCEACEEIAQDLRGPSITRWARTVEFPPPKDVAGASMTGQVLLEDELGFAARPHPPASLPPMMPLSTATSGDRTPSGTRNSGPQARPGALESLPPPNRAGSLASLPPSVTGSGTFRGALPQQPGMAGRVPTGPPPPPPGVRSATPAPAPSRGATPRPAVQRSATPRPAASRGATPRPAPDRGVLQAEIGAGPAPPPRPAGSSTAKLLIPLALALVVGLIFVSIAVVLVVVAWSYT